MPRFDPLNKAMEMIIQDFRETFPDVDPRHLLAFVLLVGDIRQAVQEKAAEVYYTLDEEGGDENSDPES